MSEPDNRQVRSIVVQTLQEVRAAERMHHGAREPCDYGRGQIDALSQVIDLSDKGCEVDSADGLTTGPPDPIGAIYVFKAQAGRDDGQVIARGPDGRISFFDRHSALSSQIRPRDKVVGRITIVRERSMVIEPIEIVGQYEVPDDGMPEAVPVGARQEAAHT
jgi:hypothetical protein